MLPVAAGPALTIARLASDGSAWPCARDDDREARPTLILPGFFEAQPARTQATTATCLPHVTLKRYRNNHGESLRWLNKSGRMSFT